MKWLSRNALALALLLPVMALLSACGEAPQKGRDVAERNSRDEPAMESPSPSPAGGDAAPKSDSGPLVDESPAPVKKRSKPREEGLDDAGSDDAGLDAAGRGRSAELEERRPEIEDLPKSAEPQVAASEAEPPPPPPTPSPSSAQPDPPAPSAPSAAVPPSPGRVSDADKVVKDAPPAPSAAPPPSATGGEGGAASRGIGTLGSAQKPAAPPAALAQADKSFDVVPVYFGTDRAVEADPARLKFGAERGHRVQLGRALVTVPTAHKVPAIERPWVIEIPYFKVKVYEEKEDPAKHFTLQELKALTKDELIALVKERLAKSAAFKDHAIVFVHGFNTSFDYALFRTAQIAYDLKFDGAPFVYSWPSGGKVASYTYDRGSAEQAEPHLAEFLDLVVKESGAKSISLIAHSMGNEVLLRVLERMRPKAPDGVVISQVILAAPDVDRDKFQNIARQIIDFAKGVTLYAASNDRALRYSASFWGGVPRAGDVPAGGPLVIPGVDTIDVSAVSTDSLGLNHSGYAENNALLNDIKLLIQTGERPPDKRVPILQPMKTETGSYWRYPPTQ